MDNVVQHLHRALAEALALRRPDIEAAPVTVAEIYQELVPYRTVRSSVGFEMNADYEHALLRLLAGEGALVRLEPEEVRATLERELTTPNPDVTLFRRFAACDVWVAAPGEIPLDPAAQQAGEAGADDLSDHDWTPAWLEEATRDLEAPAPLRPWMAEQEQEPVAQERPASPTEGVVEPEAAMRDPVNAPEPVADAPGMSVGREAEPRSAGQAPEPRRGGSGECPFCRGALPADRAVRYCPHCGVDQQLRPCARCGEVLEAGWRYCVSCGAPAPAGGA